MEYPKPIKFITTNSYGTLDIIWLVERVEAGKVEKDTDTKPNSAIGKPSVSIYRKNILDYFKFN